MNYEAIAKDILAMQEMMVKISKHAFLEGYKKGLEETFLDDSDKAAQIEKDLKTQHETEYGN